jgi:hypothetical protein
MRAPRRTSPLLLIVAWLVVGVPAAWGVSQTVMRSMDLFISPAAQPTTAPATLVGR